MASIPSPARCRLVTLMLHTADALSDPRAPRAWVLNVDAELQLEDLRPPRALRAEIERVADSLAAQLPAQDRVLRSGSRADGLLGLAWCPTPQALAQLEAAGCVVPPAPSAEVLRRVNSRPFAHALVALPGSAVARSLEEVRAAVAALPRALIRRPLGFAGRGVRRADRALSADDERWVRKGLARGPLTVDPRVEVGLCVSMHAFVGGPRGALTVQEVDEGGQWRGSRLERGELSSGERGRMSATLETADRALASAGYAGPFNVEGFRYRDAHGREAFHPLSDLNARYSMGWAVGMGAF